MGDIVFVQVICIKDKITTGTKYSILKKNKYDEFIRENDDYLFKKQLFSFNTEQCVFSGFPLRHVM